MFEELLALIEMAELSVGAERLHEALHGAAVVECAEVRIIPLAGAVQAAQIMAQQFLAFVGAEIDVRIEQE